MAHGKPYSYNRKCNTVIVGMWLRVDEWIEKRVKVNGKEMM